MRGHLSERYVSTGMCVSCRRIYVNEWRKANPERDLALKRVSREKNREANNLYSREWKKKNKPKVWQYNQVYREKNREAVKKKAKEYRDANPLVKRASEAKRRAIKKKSGGSYKPQEIKDLITKQKNKCIYCKSVLNKYHIDHIVPIISGGSNSIDNIQILCPTCNCRKSSKDHIKYANSLGLLL